MCCIRVCVVEWHTVLGPVKTSQPVPLAPAAHTNRELMQLQHQQEEIDMLKQSNADIKKELAELKKIAKRRRGD